MINLNVTPELYKKLLELDPNSDEFIINDSSVGSNKLDEILYTSYLYITNRINIARKNNENLENIINKLTFKYNSLYKSMIIPMLSSNPIKCLTEIIDSKYREEILKVLKLANNLGNNVKLSNDELIDLFK